MGLDSCDNALTTFARDVSTGTLVLVDMVRPTNPDGNSINVDKVGALETPSLAPTRDVGTASCCV